MTNRDADLSRFSFVAGGGVRRSLLLWAGASSPDQPASPPDFDCSGMVDHHVHQEVGFGDAKDRGVGVAVAQPEG